MLQIQGYSNLREIEDIKVRYSSTSIYTMCPKKFETHFYFLSVVY